MTVAAPGGGRVGFLELPPQAIPTVARDAVVLVDAQHCIAAVNEAAAQLFGYAQDDLLGQPLSRLIPQGQQAVHGRRMQRFVSSGQTERPALSHESIRGLRADGKTFPAEIAISRVDLLVGKERRPYLLAMLRDLSDARDLRAEVAMLDARARAVLELTPVAIWIVDDSVVVFANRAAAELFGVPDAGQLVGRAIGTLLRAGDPEALAEPAYHAPAPDAGSTVMHGTVRRPDGRTRDVEIATKALPDHGRTVMQMVIIDVTAQRAQAGEESKHRQELRRLAASVVAAREEERRRIARELHDELGQRLSALKMEIASLRQPERGRADAHHIAGMLEMVDSSVAALRRIAADLRPLMLDDLGLNSAIESLAREAARRMDIEVTVRLDAEDPPLAAGADIAVYRMVQEALTNVGRHAGATGVRIELRRDGDELVLTVQDNGKGFPARSMGKEGRYGLLGIRERVLMLGGRLEIDNAPGGGGRLAVRVPLAPEPGAAPQAT